MNDNINSDSSDHVNVVDFDFRRFFTKVIKNIKYLILFIIMGLVFAWVKNRYAKNIYNVSSRIHISKDAKNPFSSGVGVNLIWGGVSDKVDFIQNRIISRPHLNKVTDQLNLEIQVYKIGDVIESLIYGEEVPFEISKKQKGNVKFILANVENKLIVTHDNKSFEISDNVPFKINEIEFVIKITKKDSFKGSYSIVCHSRDQIVTVLKNNITTRPVGEQSSIINITYEGENKLQMLDIINRSNGVLINERLDKSSYLAKKTLEYIDQQLVRFNKQVDSTSIELGKIKKQEKIISLDQKIEFIQRDLLRYDNEIYDVKRQLSILESFKHSLKEYNIERLVIPTIVEIKDQNVITSISKLSRLFQERKKMLEYLTKEHPDIERINVEIRNAQRVAQNVTNNSMFQLQSRLTRLNSEKNQVSRQVSGLPEKEQQYLKVD
ncbi:MAG: hypothetical protein ACK5HU_06845, partial [Flavobacteriales bacterium]